MELLENQFVDANQPTHSTPTASALPTAFNCSTLGFLVTGSVFYEINLRTGIPFPDNLLTYGPLYIDAIGYNVLDNFVYGLAQSGIGAGDLIRIGNGGRSQLVASNVAPSILSGAVTLFLAGDVDNNGIYWACTTTTGPNNQIYIGVDLAPGSPTYGQVIHSGTASLPYAIFDWAYVQGGGDYLYALGQVPAGTNIFALTPPATALLRFSTTDFTWSIVKTSYSLQLPFVGTSSTIVGSNTWGAVYASSSGVLFGLEASGATYRFPVTDPSTTATFYSQFFSQGTIDGARCYTAPDPS